MPDFGHGNASKILDKEAEITDKISELYHNSDKWVELHHRKAYLKNGFIRAAMSYLSKCSDFKDLVATCFRYGSFFW